MALGELEKRLEESFAGLRKENKNLIDLLKFRQSQLKNTITEKDLNIYIPSRNTTDISSTLRTSSGFKTIKKDTLSTTSGRQESVSGYKPKSTDILNSYGENNAEVILSRTELGHKRAREMLSQKTKPSLSYATYVNFEQDDPKMDKYTDTLSDEETLNSSKLTSTPNLTPIKHMGHNTERTIPKSILKRRKIIDDNVHVQSKYQHTPSYIDEVDDKNMLNFSYSDEDEPSYYPSQPAGGSYIESGILNDEALDKSVSRLLNQQQRQRKLDDHIQEIEQMMGKQLLDDPGNDRQHANVIKVLEQRPKSDVFEGNIDNILEEKSELKNTAKKTMQRISPTASKSPEQLNMNPTRDGRPLLGYDWIAGVLENEGLFEQTESLLSEIKEFRRTNKEDCVGSGAVWDKTLDLRRPISPEVDDPGHTCIHSYTVNDRLFTESLNINEDGKSICPVCLVSRRPPIKEDPAFVRISIPQSTIAESYKIKPLTRKEFDPTDTYALSKHCLAGWNNSKPAALPTASSLDIRDTVVAKETTTYDEARKVAETFSRMGRLYQGKELPEDRITKELLNRTHCLRYELEVMKDVLGEHKLNVQKVK